MPGEYHTVEPGDSTTKLAFEHGLFPESVWKHAENMDLRSKRKELNVLLPGDVIFLPDKQIKEEDCETAKRHRFKRKGIPEKLNVQFLDLYGEPLADKPYTLKLDAKLLKGNLDGDGRLIIGIPPNAQTADIQIGADGTLAHMILNLGHLDPASEYSGVQARLKNLGFYHGPVDGQESESVEAAVRAFREQHELEASSEINDELRDKLKQVHGV